MQIEVGESRDKREKQVLYIGRKRGKGVHDVDWEWWGLGWVLQYSPQIRLGRQMTVKCHGLRRRGRRQRRVGKVLSALALRMGNMPM